MATKVVSFCSLAISSADAVVQVYLEEVAFT
jgi:hypothetical protein